MRDLQVPLHDRTAVQRISRVADEPEYAGGQAEPGGGHGGPTFAHTTGRVQPLALHRGGHPVQPRRFPHLGERWARFYHHRALRRLLCLGDFAVQVRRQPFLGNSQPIFRKDHDDAFSSDLCITLF